MPLIKHPIMVFLFLWMFLSWTSFLCVESAGSDEGDHIRASIKQAWTSREKNTQTIRCRYKEETTKILYPSWEEAGEALPNNNLPRVKRSVEHELKIDAEKTLNFSKQTTANLVKPEIFSEVESFDGKIGRRHVVAVDGETSSAIKTGRIVGNRLVDMPIFLAYRPLDPIAEKFDLDGSGISAASYDGIECSKITTTQKRRTTELWVAKSLDYLPIRYVSNIDKKKSIILEIKYKVEGGVPAMTEWTFDYWNTEGVLDISSHCIVASLETNAKISHEEFVIKFPENAKVNDLDTKDGRLLRKTD